MKKICCTSIANFLLHGFFHFLLTLLTVNYNDLYRFIYHKKVLIYPKIDVYQVLYCLIVVELDYDAEFHNVIPPTL